MKFHRRLDDCLPVVFFAFALLTGAALWHEAASPSPTPATTPA